jgi:hypothetical protein
MAITEGFRSDASGVFIYMNWFHALIHKGELFEINDVDDDVDIATPKYWHFKTPSSDSEYYHYVMEVDCDGGALVQFFESPTLSDDGSTLSEGNYNRNSSKSSDLLSYKDPTVSDDGKRLVSHEIGSNGGGGFFGAPSAGGTNLREFILKPNTSYIVKVTVRQDNSNVDIDVTYYSYDYTALTT